MPSRGSQNQKEHPHGPLKIISPVFGLLTLFRDYFLATVIQSTVSCLFRFHVGCNKASQWKEHSPSSWTFCDVSLLRGCCTEGTLPHKKTNPKGRFIGPFFQKWEQLWKSHWSQGRGSISDSQFSLLSLVWGEEMNKSSSERWTFCYCFARACFSFLMRLKNARNRSANCSGFLFPLLWKEV